MCSSPYTVFNAMNLFVNEKQENDLLLADIVLFERTPFIKRIAKLIDQERIFEHVILMKDFQTCRFKSVVYLFSYIFPRTAIKLFSTNGIINDEYMAVYSQNYVFTVIIGKLIRKSKLYLIEDGVGTYTWRASLPNARNRKLLLANKYLFNGKMIHNFDGQYVYLPDMISADRVKPRQLPQVPPNMIEVYKKIFNYKSNSLYSENKIIILGQGNMSVVSVNNEFSKGKSRYDIIGELLRADMGTDLILYRSHPAENEDNIPFCISTDTARNMWELECSTQIMSEHILIGFDTTALTLPKVLYNKEPTIVLLYHLFDYDNKEISLLDSFYDSIRNKYVESQKVMVIKTKEELDGAIYSIRKIIENNEFAR